ncbi:MAG: hypothetical protein Q8L86_09160, partial [Vicinamibacterales bacterium]|nr:hypothetical protein [Vicinamibacterales bacterium]
AAVAAAVPRPEAPAPPAGPPATRRPPRLSWAIAAVSVAALVAIGIGLQRSAAWPAASAPEAAATDAAEWWRSPRLMPAQITTTPGLDLHPAVSPDGHSVVYASDATGAFELYVRSLDGGSTAVALTRDGGQNVQPAWSPDGRFVAYHSYAHGGVWVVDARGGGAPRQIVDAGAHPAWSPDGRLVAYQTDEMSDVSPSAYGAQTGSTIRIVSADGADQRALTTSTAPDGGHSGPAWSPDGRWVAFTTFDAGRDAGLWVVPAVGGESRHIAEGEGLFEAVFAPDGSAIYAAGGEAIVWRVPFDTARGVAAGPRHAIAVPSVPGVRGLSIDPRGTRLVFSGLTLRSQIWRAPVDAAFRAGPPIAVTNDTSRRNSYPAFSPDGSRLAYMSRPAGQPPAIWTMNVDGTGAAQVTPAGTVGAHPSWFPDGRRLAFLSNREPATAIWMIDTATRRESVLVDAERSPAGLAEQPRGTLGELQLSPDATRVAFSVLAPDTGNRVLWLGTIEPLSLRRVSDPALWVGYPAWSPDGTQLAVEIKRGSSTHVGVLDVATATLRQITDVRGQSWVRSWSPDGTRIAYAALRDGRWDLRWIAASGGPEQAFSAPEPVHVYVRYPDWSPRGDTLVYERGELHGNLWTLGLDRPAPTTNTRR